MSTPKRIQRKRTKGWRMPEGVVYVGRPTVWGNPAHWFSTTVEFSFSDDGDTIREQVPKAEADRRARAISTRSFREILASPTSRAINRYPTDGEIRETLAGRDLACWCPLDQPCHADVLLEIANGYSGGYSKPPVTPGLSVPPSGFEPELNRF